MESPADRTAENPSLGEPSSELDRFVGVFVSPGPTFAEIARQPKYFAPLIALLLSSVAVMESMLGKIGAEQIVRQAMEVNGQGANMSPDEMQRAVSQGAKAVSITMHLSGPLWPLLLLLVVAGLGLLITNGIFGSKLSFRTSFSVAAYANLPMVLAGLIGLAMIFFGDTEQFNPKSFLPTNAGFFLDPHSVAKPLYALASSLDLFTFWVLALLGVGFSEAGGRKASALKTFACFLVPWLVITLVRMGFATLG